MAEVNEIDFVILPHGTFHCFFRFWKAVTFTISIFDGKLTLHDLQCQGKTSAGAAGGVLIYIATSAAITTRS